MIFPEPYLGFKNDNVSALRNVIPRPLFGLQDSGITFLMLIADKDKISKTLIEIDYKKKILFISALQLGEVHIYYIRPSSFFTSDQALFLLFD